MKRFVLVSMVATLVLALHQPADCKYFPQPTIAQICDQVDAIIEGTWLEADRVAIARLWLAPQTLPKDAKELQVIGLAEMKRVPRSFGKKSAQPIVTRNVALFLKFDEQNQAWEPLSTIRDGSPGVIWWDDTTCYGYVQVTNPGWYSLVPGSPADVQALRRQIEAGLAARSQFQNDLAIADSAKRAEALVRYLRPSTTPDPSGAHLFAAEKAVAKIGKDAVPALVAMIKAAPPQEEIHYLLAPLGSIGPDAAAARPILLQLLRRNDQNTGSAIVALEALGDPTCAWTIRPYLRARDSTTRFAAARALTKLGDKQSFKEIQDVIPTRIKPGDIDQVRDVLNFLYALDPAKARPVAAKIAGDPAMSPVRDQIKALKK